VGGGGVNKIHLLCYPERRSAPKSFFREENQEREVVYKVETVDIGMRAEVKTCDHRMVADVRWVNHDNQSPPVVAIKGCSEWTVVSLTKQVIRISCPMCFERIRRAMSLTIC
jgi:hypothetical protein